MQNKKKLNRSFELNRKMEEDKREKSRLQKDHYNRLHRIKRDRAKLNWVCVCA